MKHQHEQLQELPDMPLHYADELELDQRTDINEVFDAEIAANKRIWQDMQLQTVTSDQARQALQQNVYGYQHVDELPLGQSMDRPPLRAAYDKLHQKAASSIVGKVAFVAIGGSIGAAVGMSPVGEVISNVAHADSHADNKRIPIKDWHGREVPAKGIDTNTDTLIDEVPHSVLSDIATANEVDNCYTKVTTEQVGAIYQRLFTTYERNNMDPEQFERRINQVVDRYQESRTQQGLIPLPDSYDRLRFAVTGEQGPMPLPPIEEYQRVGSEYLAKFGIHTVFSWDKDTTDPAIKRVAKDVSPVAPAEADATDMRNAIIKVMRGLSLMPPSLVKDVIATDDHTDQAVRTIVFGTINDKRYGGFMSSPEGVMVIGIAKGSAPDVIGGHETEHADRQFICDTLGKGALSVYVESPDRAIGQLNGSRLRYGEDTRYDLDATNAEKGLPSHQLVGLDHTLQNGSVHVGFSRSYGTENSVEDTATIIGELMNDPVNGYLLFSNAADKTVLYEKAAYALARLEQVNPGAAEMLMRGVELARVEAQMNTAVSDVRDRLGRLVSPYTQGVPDNQVIYDAPEQIPESMRDTVRDLTVKLAVLRPLNDYIHSVVTNVSRTR